MCLYFCWKNSIKILLNLIHDCTFQFIHYTCLRELHEEDSNIKAKFDLNFIHSSTMFGHCLFLVALVLDSASAQVKIKYAKDKTCQSIQRNLDSGFEINARKVAEFIPDVFL